jgi:hypothetical protein
MMSKNDYDLGKHRISVWHDEMRDAYYCTYCLPTWRGDAWRGDCALLTIVEHTVRFLSKHQCAECDLPCDRGAD